MILSYLRADARTFAPTRHPSEGWDLPVRAAHLTARGHSLRWGDESIGWYDSVSNSEKLANPR